LPRQRAGCAEVENDSVAGIFFVLRGDRTGSANQTNETTRNKNLFFMGVVFYSLAGFFNA